MIKKHEIGFTLIEVLITAVIIVFISLAIVYGVNSVHHSSRDVELNQLAFITLSNRMEELKAQVALNRIQSPNGVNKKVCIEYKNISALVSGQEVGTGCKTFGYFSHDMKNRKTESLRTQIYDIKASIRWRMVNGYNKDTTIKLNVSQLVFN